MKVLRSSLIACVALPTLLTASPLTAQDVQYEEVTRIELAGALGTAMRVAARLGGGSTTTVSTTYIKGNRMRSDVDKSSMIFDLEGKRFIQLEHAPKTYSVMTFDEMVAHAARASEEVRAASNQRQESGPNEAETHLSFHFSVDQGGKRERIAGYDSEQYLLTMAAEGEFTPEAGAQREKGGTFVVFTEMWAAKDMPAVTAMNAFRDATAREHAAGSAALMQALAAAFADDPRLKVGFEQSVDQINKMEGIPMKTTFHFIMVAPDHKFDRQLALGETREQSPAQRGAGGALRGIAGRAAAAAAAASRQQEQSTAEEPTQATIAKVTSEIRNVRTQSLDAKLFEIPAGYSQVAVPGLQ